MTLKITVAKFKDMAFMQGVALLNLHNFKDAKAGYRAARLCKWVNAESQLAQEQFKKLVQQHAILDEKGEVAPHEGQPGTYKIKEGGEEAWKQALKEFEEVELTLEKVHPIKVTDLDGSKLTPQHLSALESVLDTSGMDE